MRELLSLFLELRGSPDSLSSGTQDVLDSCGRVLHVGLPLSWHFSVVVCCTTQLPTPSWEFLITLDYEWGVIQGRRPCRWTIWVCNDLLF